jgi:hypothetical protein
MTLASIPQSTTTAQSELRSVNCPTCGAEPGNDCISLGLRYRRKGFPAYHAARRRAAELRRRDVSVQRRLLERAWSTKCPRAEWHVTEPFWYANAPMDPDTAPAGVRCVWCGDVIKTFHRA